MGGKYEIFGWCYPYKGYYDLHKYTDSWWEARKIYKKAKKMFCCGFIVRNEKKKDYKLGTEEDL